MDEIISADRVINKYPGPYCLQSTPYLQPDFSDKTRRICWEKKSVAQDWLKINKVVIIGDVAVGKTCLVNRYCRNFFESTYKSTIGVDFEVEKFSILGIPFILQIWDTAGQERFKSIAQSYYRGSNAIIIVFDLSNCESLSNCKKWLNEAINANIGTNPFIFLVGTKRDLLNDFCYKNIQSNAQNIAREMSAEYWSVSSKTGKNINKLFRRIACLGFEKIISKAYESTNPTTNIGHKLFDDKYSKKNIRRTTNTKIKCCS